MVYLNADFTGGETKFYEDDRMFRFAVRPERGMALIFVHDQLHEGAAVVSGRKYVLRTDVMYTSPAEKNGCAFAGIPGMIGVCAGNNTWVPLGHLGWRWQLGGTSVLSPISQNYLTSRSRHRRPARR